MNQEIIIVITILAVLIILINVSFWLVFMPWLVDHKISGFQNDLISKYYDEVEIMYRKMRSWRHDYHNHILLYFRFRRCN